IRSESRAWAKSSAGFKTMTTAAAKTAKIAITMRSSTRVNPPKFCFTKFWRVNLFRLRMDMFSYFTIEIRIDLVSRQKNL
ncbi:MAG: hypothetical protein M0Q27_02720, partial [Candidatus Colwellbacteria bacterium]|nr:hypothetical protein [Candidatus Colwellbacteria bacterium]